MTEWGWSEMSSFSLPHPATGVKAIQTTLLFRPAACWRRGGGAGGGGAKRQMTLQTCLSVLDITERFEYISSGKIIHLFLVYCFLFIAFYRTTRHSSNQRCNKRLSQIHLREICGQDHSKKLCKVLPGDRVSNAVIMMFAFVGLMLCICTKRFNFIHISENFDECIIAH